ncbi:MAG: Monoacylglycerol lipase [Mycobacterium sp.]|nr:Monoacylglycerol lipase [Mycobacterium sp.]
MTLDVHMADVRGTRIAYRDSGCPAGTEVPAFIWAHSLLASMAQEDATGIFDWTPLLDQARVIRYDARGHGASAIGREPPRQTWPELAADMLGLLDFLAIKQAIGGGASMGCGTLLHAACRAPGRFPALVLALPPTAWSGRRNQTLLYRTVGMLAANPVIDVAVRGFSAVRSTLPSPRRTPRRALISAGMDQFLREPRRTVGPFKGAALTDLPDEAELAALTMPCLILAWADDRMHPVSVAKRLHELLPGSDLMIATSDEDILEWPKRVAEFLAGLEI